MNIRAATEHDAQGLLNGRDSEAYKRNFYPQRGWVERERMANFIFPLR